MIGNYYFKEPEKILDYKSHFPEIGEYGDQHFKPQRQHHDGQIGPTPLNWEYAKQMLIQDQWR